MEDFFSELEECLRGEVSDTELRDSMEYYRDYFREQRFAGKSEEEILAELGSPRLIARSIIDAREAADEQQEGRYDSGGYSEDASYEEYPNTGEQEEGSGRSVGSKIMTALIVIAILIVLGMVIRVLLPVILVVIAVIIIAGLFRRRE